ncbi:MAG TPA: S53 family serine peptidase [Aliidongia sp.]|nr:S53 family serine peptidase [Aliidongia sp.]
MKRIGRLSYTVAGILGAVLATGHASAFEKGQIGTRAMAQLPVEFDIYVPIQNRADLEKLEADQTTPGSAQYHKWLSPTEFNARFAPSPALVKKMSKELAASGITVTEVHTHSLHAVGTASAIERAFSTELATTKFSNGRSRLAATRAMVLTPTLLASGAVISTFSNTIHMKKPLLIPAGDTPDNRTSPTGGYWFDDLKQAYQFPSNKVVNGKGVTIGILMEAGQSQADTNAYFAHEGVPTPKITEINLYGATPYDPTNPFNSAEIQLDIQQSGGTAPGASIVHYNIPDLNDTTLLAAITQIDEDNAVDVVSMSFGGGEVFYTPDYNGGQDFSGILVVFDDLFAQGNAEGITFVASSGDFGSNPVPALACLEPGATAGCGGFVTTAESPASSPHVTGVGGTNLVTSFTSGSLASTYVSENANPDPVVGDPDFGTPATGAIWASGGGTSIVYKKPDFQKLVATGAKMRAVPDVSLHMGGCPSVAVKPCGPNRSFDEVGINGGFFGFIGTSASAPDFAGLMALKIQWLGGRLGNENTQIYQLAAQQLAGGTPVYRQNIPGSNGVFVTKKKGYNEVLGNGTIIGTAFLLDPTMPAAGNPQTPSNP